jgi:hypothetical protein
VTVFMCESGGTFLLCVTPHDSGVSLSASSLPQKKENKDDISCTFLRYSLAEPRQERTIKCKRGKGEERGEKHVSGRERGGGGGKGKGAGEGGGGMKGDLLGRKGGGGGI